MKPALPAWCRKPILLDLWRAARENRRDPMPRLVACDLMEDLASAGEAGPEAVALAACLRESIQRVASLQEAVRAHTNPMDKGPDLSPFRRPSVLPAEFLGAIPGIHGALHGWPLTEPCDAGDTATRLWTSSPLTHRLADGVWMEMVPMMSGSFRMVSRGRAIERIARITFPFLISKVPVNWAQWEAVLEEPLRNPSQVSPRGATFAAAESFCERFREKTGLSIWLPTEAQWEYAEGGWNRRTAVDTSGASLAERLSRGGPNDTGICRGPEHCWEWCRDHWNPLPAEGRFTDPVQEIPDPDGLRVIRRLGSVRYSSRVAQGMPARFTHPFRVIQRIHWDGTWKTWDFETGLSG